MELNEISQWFVAVKAPDLKEKVFAGLKTIESGQPLEGNFKKLFGFMLFSFSMNHGPASFIDIEELAEKICVTEEFKDWAKNWIDSAKTQRPPQPAEASE